jgi:hypothetical protein
VQGHPTFSKLGKLTLNGTLIERNHAVGVFITGAEATLAATAVRATQPAEADSPLGDGILVMDEESPSSATVVATESTGNARSGLLYVGSAGHLSGVRASLNRFGLVLQPGSTGVRPVLDDDNAFEKNTEANKLFGGDLPVPDTLPPLPP